MMKLLIPVAIGLSLCSAVCLPAAAQTFPPIASDTAVDADELRASADAGDVDAAMQLVDLLLQSSRPADQQQEGLTYLEMAAEAGNVEAMSRWGNVLNWGQYGVKPNHEAAKTFYERAVLANDNTARRGLAGILSWGRDVERDPERAVELLELAVAEDDAWAATQLAANVISGTGTEVDPQRALELYQIGVDADITLAMVGLADLYRSGSRDVVAKDPEAAFELLKRAEAAGDKGARLRLADMMVRGEGTEVDFDRGMAMLRELGEEGNAGALVAMADYYAGGIGTEADGALALDYYEQAIDAGSSDAFGKMGQLLRRGGPGLDPDPVAAYAAFTKAAEAGDKTSRRTLAEMMAAGEGTDADPAGALEIFTELAAKGDQFAAVAAGDLLATGQSMLPDVERALAFYKQAEDAGNLMGTLRAADLYRMGTVGFPPAPARAVPFLEAAIERNNNNARRNLATLLVNDGDGVRNNVERAVDLLDEAVAAGDMNAAMQLGELYSGGKGVRADYDRAMSAFQLAVDADAPRARIRQALAILNGPLKRDYGDEGLELLRSAYADGVTGAALELAKLQASGNAGRDEPADAVATITPAAESGDVPAIRYLISLRRDGIPNALRPDLDTASELITKWSDTLGPELTALERLYLDIARPPTRERLAEMATNFAALSPNNAISALHRLRWSDANSYVAVLQAELANRGYYDGAMTATLTRDTIRAVQRFCRDTSISADCSIGPMSAEAVTSLARTLSLPR